MNKRATNAKFTSRGVCCEENQWPKEVLHEITTLLINELSPVDIATSRVFPRWLLTRHSLIHEILIKAIYEMKFRMNAASP